MIVYKIYTICVQIVHIWYINNFFRINIRNIYKYNNRLLLLLRKYK
jgi:hypothetical protein